ncbi:uncharacterized protein LOC113284018 [Papaver somniferum]|uniref:uncharacterized protein LOC113284018 n=1 Tax=Papaver somniferum TaxID=3469 RepID=UPI000E7011C0|nr:uncharacterized protein LOC113284018 [Papaver somniferum]
MRTLNPRSIFIFATSSSSSHLLSSLKRGVFHFSSSSSSYDTPPSSSSSSSSEERRMLWKNHEEERKTVRVSVWWDFENCVIPNGVNVAKVAQRITSALRTNGIKGPVTITAFGDVLQLSSANQESLSATGISLYHVPCGKNNADRSLLVDLVYWVSQNPPPAHLLLISGDRDFANVLHRLRMSNYNVLLACNDTPSDVLCSAASIMWCWNGLVRGEKLTGRHFNQPPDGTYSWYGHYKGVLEDPFPDTEKPSCSKLEQCVDPKSDVDPPTLPEALTDKICQIVDSHANGVEISLLCNELRSQVSVDKDFFGHKKFSNLLMSLPDLLKLRRTKDGTIIVHSVRPKIVALVNGNLNSPRGLETSKNESYQNGSTDLTGSEGDTTADDSEKLKLQSVDPQKEPPSIFADEIGSGATLSSSNSVKKGLNLHHSKENISNSAEKSSTTSDVGKITPKVDSLESRIDHLSPSDTETSAEDDKKPGIFGKIVYWFKILIHGPQADQSNNKSGEDESEKKGKAENHETLSTTTDHANGKSGIVPSNIQAENHETAARNTDHADDKSGKDETPKNIQAECRELFSKSSFWDEIKIFLHSQKGASLIKKSMTITRLQIAEELQKKGPAVLKTLSGAALIHLTHLLIVEKKWLKHYSTQTQSSPSNVIHPRLPPSHDTNGLRAILSAKSVSQRNLPGLSVPEGEKEHSDHTEKGVNYGKLAKQMLTPYQKKADQMQKDCQKLVAEILEKYPEGFSIGSIQDLFRENYGYSLKYQVLGHSKLASLMQSIPGVRIEGAMIVPSEKLPRDFSVEKICHTDNNIGNNNTKDVNLSKSVGNGDNSSAWEELGPVCNTKSDGNVTIDSDYNRKKKLEMSGSGVYNRDYDLTDTEYSDSDSELTRKDLQEGLQKKGGNYKDGALIQILDTYYTGKEGSDVGGSRNDSRIMDSDIETGFGRTAKARKSFTFVEDTAENEKGKLIHSILGTLQKSDRK